MSCRDGFRSQFFVGRGRAGLPILDRTGRVIRPPPPAAKGCTVTRRTLKLGAVLLGVGGPGQHDTWLSPEIPGDASVDIRWYTARARQAEAAKFDHVFIVDSQFITPDSPHHYLNRLEPLTLLSAVAVHTSHIGLVGTLTTSYNDPFNVARRLASLGLIRGGRQQTPRQQDCGSQSRPEEVHDRVLS